MDRCEEIGTIHSDSPLQPQPPSERACPECAERSCLRELVAELLYKNQILRLDLESAQERLMKAILPQEIGGE